MNYRMTSVAFLVIIISLVALLVVGTVDMGTPRLGEFIIQSWHPGLVRLSFISPYLVIVLRALIS
jgi:hypothetical protein